MILGVILAGGQATRMGGGDKPLRPFANATLLDAVIARLAPQVTTLALSANGSPSRFARFNLPVLADAQEGQGPLAGILAALHWATASGASHLLTAPGDTPFLPEDLAARLSGATPPSHAASANRNHWAIALIPTVLTQDLSTFLASGGRAPRAWLALHHATAVTWPATPTDPFTNINTPQDLAAAEQRHP